MTAVTGPPLEEIVSPVTDPRVPEAPSGHRPHLDGIRSLAVYLVVAFHAGLTRFSGGFIGVDVFFVLSGYLVTGLLLRDLRANGRIRLTRFYARRIRRLLPAALVTLFVTGIVFSAVASPLAVADALRSIRASCLYVANWSFIRQSNDYFGKGINSSPVVHFWSLAIEEQFYLLWPLTLGGLYWLTRRAGRAQWRALRTIVAVAAGGSALLALGLASGDLNRAYYGTDARAYELLAGAFVALTPSLVRRVSSHRREARLATILSLLAVLALGSWAGSLNPIQRGVLVTLLTCVALVTIEAADGLARRALSLGPVAYLGRISYGTYLWHWPIIVIAAQVVTISPSSLFLVTCLAATGIASLSYQVLEGPVRQSSFLTRHGGPVIVSGLALSVLGGLVLAPAVLRIDSGSGGAGLVSSVRGGTRVPSDIDWRAVLADRAHPPDCLHRAARDCTVVDGQGQRILLMGDSHAAMLSPAFVALAQRRGDRLSLAIANSCPWQEGLVYTGPAAQQASCRDHKADWAARVIPALDPDVIVLVGRSYDDPTNSMTLRTASGRVVAPHQAGYEDAVRSATVTTLAHLRRGGRKVVIVEPVPTTEAANDPLLCLSTATFLDQCRYVASPSPMPVERIYRALAGPDPTVWSLDIDALVCPYLPICDPMVKGMVVKFDEGHVTATYARALNEPIEQLLVDNRILPP